MKFDTFLSDSLEHLPRKIEQEELKFLIETGNADAIIKGHMRLGLSIAAEKNNRQWNDDLIGVVFLELTRRVHYILAGKTKRPIDETNITAYLAYSMRKRRDDFLYKFPQLIKSPRRKKNEIKLLIVEDVEENRKELDPSFSEILTLILHTEEEKQVITFKAQGYTATEIAPIMDKSTRWVGRITESVEDRFNEAMDK